MKNTNYAVKNIKGAVFAFMLCTMYTQLQTIPYGFTWTEGRAVDQYS